MFDAPGISEALKTYILETAPVVALYLDAEYCVADANTKARKLLRKEALGRPLAEQIVDFTGALDLPALIRQEKTVHRLTLSTLSGMPETLYFQFFPLTGGVLAFGSLDFQEQQKLRYETLELNRELNNMTRELHQANAQLRELNELKNRFIGMAAHDLRKPVGIIMTYNEFLLDEAAKCLNEEQRGFLRTSMAAATGMKRLIDNFLDVSVIESGNLRLELSPVGIDHILTDVLPMISVIAARKKVELITEVTNDGHHLAIDIAKIQQALINLLSNAIEHSSTGQRVWLTARLEDNQLIFSVRDEGPGITDANQQKIFVPFARAGTSKTAGERSVGLGLAIARQVIEAHGGRIWVESKPEQGSTFFIALPTGDKR